MRWVLVSTYVIAGLCAGIGAAVLAGRTGDGSPLYGTLLELTSIAAVIIGCASFLGGRGHVGHALVGEVMIGVIRLNSSGRLITHRTRLADAVGDIPPGVTDKSGLIKAVIEVGP